MNLCHMAICEYSFQLLAYRIVRRLIKCCTHSNNGGGVGVVYCLRKLVRQFFSVTVLLCIVALFQNHYKIIK